MKKLNFIQITWIFIGCGILSFLLLQFITPLVQIPLFVLGLLGTIMLPFSWFTGPDAEEGVGLKITGVVLYALGAPFALIIIGLLFMFQLPTSYPADSAISYDYYREIGLLANQTCYYYDQTSWFTMKQVDAGPCY